VATRQGRGADNNAWYRYHAPRRLAALTERQIVDDRARADCDLEAVLTRTGLVFSDRILEVGCGWGRHSLALAGRGFSTVVSVDIAPEPLRLARALAREAGLRCHLRRQDVRHVSDGPFAAVLSLYDRSVCGFPSEEEDARSLRHLAGLLQPNGWLVFGIDDWPFHLPEASQQWRETSQGLELVEVIPDRCAMICTHRVVLIRPDGQREVHALTRRHYYLPELRRLLAAAGFNLVTARHRLGEERPYGDGGEGLFVYARRLG
jgi:SAM-dependent methyltransferase